MSKRKWWKISLLSALAALTAVGFAACNKVPKGYTGAADYYDTEWELGENIELREVVNFVQIDRATGEFYFDEYDLETRMLLYPKVEYTLILTDGKESIDLSRYTEFELRDISPGEWKFIYTVTEDCIYKGTFEIPIKIVAPKLTAELTVDEITTTQYFGTTITFEDMLYNMNANIRSYFPYTATFSQVVVNGQTKDLTGTDRYTFNDLGEHVFTLYIESEDGQTYTQDITMNVIYNAVGEKYVYLMKAYEGTVNIPLDQEFDNFTINSQAFEYTENEDGSLEISKSWLYTHPGLCQIAFTDADGENKCYNLFVVTDTVDFEDGVNIINAVGMSNKPPVVDGVVSVSDATQGNGRGAIGVKPTDWSVYVGVDSDYIKGVFAEPLVEALTFKVYTSQSIANKGVNSGIYLGWNYDNQWGNQRKTGIFAEDMGDYLLVTYTRAGYEAWAAVIDAEDTLNKDVCQFLFRFGDDDGTGTAQFAAPTPFYLDDFVAVKAYEIVKSDTIYAMDDVIKDYTGTYSGTMSEVWVNGTPKTITASNGEFTVPAAALRSGVNQITFLNEYGERVEYRVIIYTTKVDFEDGFNTLTTPGQNDTTEFVTPQTPTDAVPIATTSNTIKHDPNDWDLHIGINALWVKEVLAQTSATGIQFKIYTHLDGMGEKNASSGANVANVFKLYSATDEGNVAVWSGYTCEDKGDYLLFTLPRATLEQWFALNDASANKSDVMTLHLRLGKLDTNEASPTYGYKLWGAFDFVYLDDFEAVFA